MIERVARRAIPPATSIAMSAYNVAMDDNPYSAAQYQAIAIRTVPLDAALAKPL
jgi:hypothetical protein